MDERNGMVEKVSSPESFNALRYHEHGKPIEVLRLEKLSIPPCASGEVTIQMEAAALHPSDIGLIVGSYGTLRPLPTVAGREGVGTICAVGKGVDEKLLGRPVALPFYAGAWQEYMNEKADQLILLPSLVRRFNCIFSTFLTIEGRRIRLVLRSFNPVLHQLLSN